MINMPRNLIEKFKYFAINLYTLLFFDCKFQSYVKITMVLFGVILTLCLLSSSLETVLRSDDIPELKYVDDTADPCTSFYEFACGNFKKYHSIPPKDKEKATTINQYTLLQEEMVKVAKEILRKKIKYDDPAAIKRAKIAYQSCVNIDNLGFNLKAPEIRLIENNGDMPMLASDPSEIANFTWTDVGGIASRYGVPMLFNFFITANSYETEGSFIYISQDSLEQPTLVRPKHEKSPEEVIEESLKEYAVKKPVKKVLPFDKFLRTVMYYVRDQTGSRVTNDDINTSLDEMAAFWRGIHLYKGLTSNNVPEFTGSTIGDLQNWTDASFGTNHGLNWVQYVNAVLEKSGVNVTSDSLVLANAKDLYNVINLVRNTDSRVIKNFVFIRLILYSAMDSSRTVRRAFREYYTAIKNNLYSRKDYCARTLIDAIGTAGFSFAVAHDYYRYHFDANKITKLVEMVESLTKVLERTIDDSPWMDDKSKVVARKKAANMIGLIGFPDFVLNRTRLDEFYENVGICEWNNYENMQNLRAFKQAHEFSQLNKRDRLFWDKSPFEANAYYNRPNNRIIIPIAMLNPVFFYGNMSLLDFARIGSILGHEITHAFDVEGQKYNEDGILKPWWTEQTYKSFKEKSSCFIDQYSAYHIKEINQTVNGSQCLNENIADNGGIRKSYLAFNTLGGNLKISTSKYDSDQLFFLGYATAYCSDDTVKYLQWLQTRNYPPNKFRVDGPLSNMEEFAKAFKCPKGSPMNPVNKCILW